MEDLPNAIIPVKFGSNWSSGFRGEHILLNIGQLETGIVFEGQVFCQIRIKRKVLVGNLPNTIPAQCGPN